MFSVGLLLPVAADFHMETVSQVEAHVPPGLAAALHTTLPGRNKQLSRCPFSATRDSKIDVVFQATDCEHALQPWHLI